MKSHDEVVSALEAAKAQIEYVLGSIYRLAYHAELAHAIEHAETELRAAKDAAEEYDRDPL